jgi:hypothetical protein
MCLMKEIYVYYETLVPVEVKKAGQHIAIEY